MEFSTLYTLGSPSLLGLILLVNFFYWRFKAQSIEFRSCILGWVWFLSSAAVGEALAHLFYPSNYAGLGNSAAQIFGFLIALVLSPVLSFAAWAITRKLVKTKQKKAKQEDRQRLKEMRKAAESRLKEI